MSPEKKEIEQERKEEDNSKEQHTVEHHKAHHEHHKEEHSEHQKSIPIKFSLNSQNISIVLTILLGIFLIVNIVLTFSINKEFKKNIEASIETAKEIARPAKIELLIIKNSKCSDCFDILPAIAAIKSTNVNITKEKLLEFDSKEGKELIIKYGIQKVPALVLTGETNKFNAEGLEKKDNALLWLAPKPPYTNAATGSIEGRVTLYLLKDSQCSACNDLSILTSQIKASGIRIFEQKIIEASSDEGKSLLAKYNINFAPTLILSKDAAYYDIMQQDWLKIGSKENDGSYVLRSVYPPFINLTTGKLRGIVDAVYLTDKSCAECYNVSLHKNIIASPQSFAIKLNKEEYVDAGEQKGKQLIAKHNITQVPTVILSNEVSAYPSSQLLKQFFSVDKDGSYIFNKGNLMGAYKDIATGQIVKPQPQQEGQEN